MFPQEPHEMISSACPCCGTVAYGICWQCNVKWHQKRDGYSQQEAGKRHVRRQPSLWMYLRFIADLCNRAKTRRDARDIAKACRYKAGRLIPSMPETHSHQTTPVASSVMGEPPTHESQEIITAQWKRRLCPNRAGLTDFTGATK